jgi:hypothetical protein
MTATFEYIYKKLKEGRGDGEEKTSDFLRWEND